MLMPNTPSFSFKTWIKFIGQELVNEKKITNHDLNRFSKNLRSDAFKALIRSAFAMGGWQAAALLYQKFFGVDIFNLALDDKHFWGFSGATGIGSGLGLLTSLGLEQTHISCSDANPISLSKTASQLLRSITIPNALWQLAFYVAHSGMLRDGAGILAYFGPALLFGIVQYFLDKKENKRLKLSNDSYEQLEANPSFQPTLLAISALTLSYTFCDFAQMGAPKLFPIAPTSNVTLTSDETLLNGGLNALWEVDTDDWRTVGTRSLSAASGSFFTYFLAILVQLLLTCCNSRKVGPDAAGVVMEMTESGGYGTLTSSYLDSESYNQRRSEPPAEEAPIYCGKNGFSLNCCSIQ
jgi:hypothetical protein